MIRDWDLWPGLIAYESDWGRRERLIRAGDALRRAIARVVGVSARQAAESWAALTRAYGKHQPAFDETARK